MQLCNDIYLTINMDMDNQVGRGGTDYKIYKRISQTHNITFRTLQTYTPDKPKKGCIEEAVSSFNKGGEIELAASELKIQIFGLIELLYGTQTRSLTLNQIMRELWLSSDNSRTRVEGALYKMERLGLVAKFKPVSIQMLELNRPTQIFHQSEKDNGDIEVLEYEYCLINLDEVVKRGLISRPVQIKTETNRLNPDLDEDKQMEINILNFLSSGKKTYGELCENFKIGTTKKSWFFAILSKLEGVSSGKSTRDKKDPKLYYYLSNNETGDSYTYTR